MTISYDNSKAVKINSEMRNNLNIYNQRRSEIDNYSRQIAEYQKELEEKNKEISTLEIAMNGDDKKAAKEANKKLKGLQKETERILSAISDLEHKKIALTDKQNSANVVGVQTKSFPENEAPVVMPNDTIGEYKEEESFIPVEEYQEPEKENLSQEDLDAIWDKLHTVDEKDNEEATMEEITPVYEEPEVVEPIYENAEVVEEETPVSIFSDSSQMIEPVTETNLEDENPSIIEPTVISEEPIVVTEETEIPDDIITTDNESVQEQIHREVDQEFPKIEVPEPMDSEKKLKSIYEEVDVEPKLLDKSTTRDLKNLTLFVDYNDYTFTFGQQHYNKEALTPEEIEKLSAIKSYLNENDFNAKRTIQYNKITAENKRLNRKIVTLSKEFTKTVDKLSKDYVKTTDELTKQTNKAKEQVEIDRVEKVQTQKLNDSLTDNIKEQNDHIDKLTEENNGLKETIEARDKTIKDLKDDIKEKADKIKVFEEKLNTVLGIVKEVKSDKKDK